MLQAAVPDCLLLDPFSSQEDFLSPSEVDVSRSEIAQTLVVPVVIVMLNEVANLGFQVFPEEVVFQQNPVLQGLMPTLDFSLCLRVAWSAMDLLHSLVIQPFAQIFGNITGAITPSE